MRLYPVKYGESITDVVINATGSISNWDAVLDANGFVDWTPNLVDGQMIIIPDNVSIDQNTLRDKQVYPVCNNVSEIIYEKINQIFNQIALAWILTTGFWNDNALWRDDQNWND